MMCFRGSSASNICWIAESREGNKTLGSSCFFCAQLFLGLDSHLELLVLTGLDKIT